MISSASDAVPLPDRGQDALRLLDTLGEVVFQTDAEGRWTYLNQAWTRLTGFEVGPSLGSRFLDYVHPDELQHTIALFMAVVAGGADHCHHETRYRTRDGSYRRVQIRAMVIRDDAGEVVGNTGTILDVTASRHGTETIGEHAALLELVSAQVPGGDLPVGVALYGGADRRLRRASPVIDRIAGRPQRIGTPLAHLVELLRPVDPRQWQRALSGPWGLISTAITTRQAQTGDIDVTVGNGPVLSLRVSVIPYAQDGDDLLALVLADVTDLRRAERRQAGLARLGDHAVSGHDVDSLVAEATALVTSTLDATECELIRLDDSGGPTGTEAGTGAGPGTSPGAGPDTGTGPSKGTSPSTDAVPGAGAGAEAGLAVESGGGRGAGPGAGAAAVSARLAETRYASHGDNDLTILTVRIGSHWSPYGLLAIARSPQSRRFTEDETTFVQSVAHVLTAAIERERAEHELRRLYERAERGNAWLAASARMTAAVLVAPDQVTAFDTVATLARQMAGVDLATVAVPDENGNLVVTTADIAAGLPVGPEELRGLTIRLSDERTLDELARGAMVILDRLDLHGSRLTPVPDLPFATALVVPMRITGNAPATLILCNRAGIEHHQPRDHDLVQAFANDASLALELVHAQQERARLAVFKDRDRIARDLHDQVIQRLFAVGLQLQSLIRLIGDLAAARLTAATNALDQTIDDIRRTIFNLQTG
ncbi:PAS domain S-box-containing protein [Parafrankia irregularis]|uniref:histidine kinase n=1 Tax=Parafrankia irregularis TaxID=795642 RepID=A0A0S4QXF7_9ACTN|nr:MULTISPECIES: PAS domain-containing protein [Parafrankia]MBE3204869.1 PAS domain-containing protein [Parafrankia sp. CH37]CUU59222.1 PAS domain S-box-containing protein [Parafrankia irregularis]